MADRKFKCKFSHTVIMNCFSLKTKNAMISRTSKCLEIFDLDGLEPKHLQKSPTLTIPRLYLVIHFKSMSRAH